MADLDVDSMTDAELRTKLAEHGFPVMPVTASTRKLLVKKLKLVLSEKGKSRNSMNPKGDARTSVGIPSGAAKADQVDSMSDAEIQAKLSEHGHPVMPITASTRALFVKKLKGILEKGNSRATVDNSKFDSRHSLLRYSSGEESDLDNQVKEKRGRRQTTGGAMLPPSASKTRRATKKRSPSPVKMDTDKQDSDSDQEKSPIRTHEEVETVTTRRITRTFANEDEFETGSDSDVDVDKKSTSFRSNSRSSDYISSSFPVNPSANQNYISSTSPGGLSPTQSPAKPSRLTRPSTSPACASSYSGISSSDHLNSIRSRLGLTSTLGDRPSFYTSAYNTPSYQPSSFQPSTSTIDEVESPYLSNFTRRLTALKPEPTPKPTTSFIDRDTTNGSTMLPRRSYLSGVSRTEEYKPASEKKFMKNNLVSFALLGLVGLFFFCLFFMYIVKKNDITSVADDQNSVIPICQFNLPGNNRPGINCVPKEQVSYAKDLLKIIHPELTARIAAYKCGQPNTMPYLTDREVLDIACARVNTADQCRTDLNNLQVLVINNPRWGLSVVQLTNLYTKDAEYTPIGSTDLIVQQRTKGSVAITLSDPSTPLSCLFFNTLYSAGSSIIVIALLTLLAFGGQKGYKFYTEYRKRKSEEIYSMVEQIIDLVYQETEDSGEPYLSVDHVRDTLISAQNKEKMASTWDAAVKFIQRNESRVRMEVQSVDGEDCRVWRWLAPAHASPKRGASWQGQAFETQEGSVNNVPEAPTPCLKIRHMFDKNDNNPNLRSILQEAILEKCDRCNILHIDLDRASYCVYVKCATPTDASVVYRSMHGWWYEGKLITVKYLRLERYMMRFPDSPSIGPYLKPNSRPIRE